MDFRVMGLDAPLMSTLHHLMMDSSSPYIPDDDATDSKSSSAAANGSGSGSSAGTYVRDARAMASTPVDVKEVPSAYVFVVDMPGVRSGEIKVQVEDGNVLVISGERKRGGGEEEKEGKYLRMERRMGKFMRKFTLPENADTEDGVSAACADGVLTVTVKKLPPPEPKKPKTIEVKVA